MTARAAAIAAIALAACGQKAASAPTPPPPAPAAGNELATIEVPDALRAVVDAKDRSADDRALDAGRHPAELLAFARIEPGMKVAELGAGGGYTAELLARAVGPTGTVYGQNPAKLRELPPGKAWAARLAAPVMNKVVDVARELDAPLPAEARDLDAVFLILFYHDTVWLGVDRAKMNRAVFDALRPGGVFIVADHSARTGTGTADAQTLHRIEETVVLDEILAAGFRFDQAASILRNPDDPRDWNAAPGAAGPKRGQSDRFLFRFVKP